MDIMSVGELNEPGCLEFLVSEKWVWVVKPGKLSLEYISELPADSFLMLELDPLSPIFPDELHGDYSETVAELAPDRYEPGEVWDQNFFGYDDEGREIPLPDDARMVTRWLKGKILIVTKGSLWNGISETYDGRHNAMSLREIRDFITKGLAARAAR